MPSFLPVLIFLLYLCTAGLGEKYVSGDNEDKDAAVNFLFENDVEAGKMCKKATTASWNYDNNLTEANKQIMLEVSKEYATFEKETWRKSTSFAWKKFKEDDPLTYRWFKALSVLGDSALPDQQYQELQELIASMSSNYSTAKVCPQSYSCENPTLDLEPDLGHIMAKSEDYEELQYAWVNWRNATGKQMKESFLRYVDLKNEAAKLNGFQDAGELWIEGYESETFQEDVEKLLNDLKPFYTQLHAYIRKKLMQKYPGKIRPDGPIPAHLLGNMWAQKWDNIFEFTKPYPNETEIDVSRTMKEKGMTPLDMFKISEEFFTSLGLIKMTPEFWNNSVIEKPTDREIVCHASAWDFCDGKDVRIKMCTEVNMEDLITVHHEMGHIEYYLQYSHYPQVFRHGANPGFHEAVGDVLALSVSTPAHLKEIGLLDDVSASPEADINYLLKMAMSKVAFLPFSYLLDLWRWNVFSGNIEKDELNTRWWEMRLKFQGLCPPVKRTEYDLDPAAKYHVISDVPYIRYFVSTIIQFQFHRALCKEAGYEGPLHKCDIYRNKDAGKLLSQILSGGSSVIWHEAMFMMTRGETNQMDASGILEYFDPLIKWLEKENEGEFLGWTNDDPTRCP